MINFSAELKRSIYDCIMSQDNPLGRYNRGAAFDDLNVVDFLKLIWDLPTMPSEDPRFRNAEADACQHMLNNNDWTLEYAFLIRFNLLAGKQDVFIKFIEVMVSPEVRESKDDIDNYARSINSLLEDVDFELAIYDYINGLPCYRLMEGKLNDTVPIDLRPNTIPIFVDEQPDEYPAFRLTREIWDDYGYKTRYRLYYFPDSNNAHNVGLVKIMKKDAIETYGILPSRIFAFDDEFCSLGQSLTYYENIKKILGNKYKDFLNAIRDTAIFSSICDVFCNTDCYKHSLLRYQDAEKALLYAVYILAGYTVFDPIRFVFKAELPYYKGEQLGIKFDMGDIQSEYNLNRVIAIIGNNGVGKTSVLSQLAECIVNDNEDRFAPRKPVFKKVISASYSVFDKFFNIEGTSFNYTYCGIQKKNGVLLSNEEISARRRISIELIHKHDRDRTLYNYIKTLLPDEFVDVLFDDLATFKEEEYSKIYPYLSSGQSMLMNLIIEIVANIRHNTLILIDEPEVHLHPKGITTFVNILNRICREFFSCCILATHSSIIVQELLSRNVIVMDRDEQGDPIVRPMRVESFGENLTTITEEIFGRGEVSPYYKTVVRKLVDQCENIDDVISHIQNNEVPISMALYMLIDKYFSDL